MGYYFKQYFPESNNLAGTLRMSIVANDFEKQDLQPRTKHHVTRGGLLAEWDMVAPTEIFENLSHTWEEYDSIQGNIAQALSTANKSYNEVLSIANAAEATGADVGNFLSNSTLARRNYVIDSPLVYKGSPRREYNLTFPMAEWSNIGGDVIDPIVEFRRLSCADSGGGSTDIITWPAIFTVKSVPYPFIYIRDAVLISVQITYKSPYKNGMPQSADLVLTFKDITALYRSSFGDYEGIVTAGQKENAGRVMTDEKVMDINRKAEADKNRSNNRANVLASIEGD